MSDERLSDSDWKTFAGKHSIKDPGLLKHLTALGKCVKQDYAAQLAVLTKIEKDVEALKKSYKSERLTLEYLKDVLEGVESERKEIELAQSELAEKEKLAKSNGFKPGSKTPETAKPGNGTPDASKKSGALIGSRGPVVSKPVVKPTAIVKPTPVIKPTVIPKPMVVAKPGGGAKPGQGTDASESALAKIKSLVSGALSMVKSKKPDDKQLGFVAGIGAGRSRVLLGASAQRNILQQLLAGITGVKFYQGECRWEEGAYTFVLDAVPGGLSKQLKTALLEETGATHRVRVRSRDGKTVADSETEKDDSTGATGQPGPTTTGTTPQQTPSTTTATSTTPQTSSTKPPKPTTPKPLKPTATTTPQPVVKPDPFKNLREADVLVRAKELDALGRLSPSIDGVLGGVKAAQKDSSKLEKSKGLDILLDDGEKVQKAYQAVLRQFRDLDPAGIDAFLLKLATAQKNIATYQRAHPGTGSSEDKIKHQQAETMRAAYEELHAGLLQCKTSLGFIAQKLAKTDDAALAGAIGYLQKVVKSTAPPELKMGAQIKIRELTQAMLASATTPQRKQEICDLVGGEVGESLARQLGKPPLKDALQGSKREDDFQKFKIVNARGAGLTEHARVLADRMIDDQTGAFEPGALLLQDPADLATSLGQGAHAKHMVRAMKKLRDKPELGELLQSIPAPAPDNPMSEMIRATLGLKAGTKITEAHARKAVLSSYLAELRQGSAGSCFATFFAIQLHDNKPERMLADMKELCATGRMVRKVGNETVEIPLQRESADDALKAPLSFNKSDGRVSRVNGGPTKPIEIEKAPPFDKLVATLGLADAGKDVAAALPRLRLLGALEKALEKLPGEQRAAVRRAVTREIDEKGLTDVTAMPQLLTTHAPVGGKITAEAQADALDESKKYLAANRYDVPAGNIMKALVLKSAGLTDSDLLLREQREELFKEFKAKGGQDKQLADQLRKLNADLQKKAAAFQKYEETLGTAKNDFASQQDNRLLRAWEFTVSSMAERGASKTSTEKMNRGTTQAFTETATEVFADLKAQRKGKGGGPQAPSKFETKALQALEKMPSGDVDKITKQLQQKYQELLAKKLKGGYDASASNAGVASDGKSTQGAFFLYDTQGIEDPTKWIKIDNEKKYAELTSGLAMLAWEEAFGGEKDEAKQDVSRYAAERLSAALGSEAFVQKAREKSEKINKKDTPKGEEVSAGKLSPWQHVDGSWTSSVTSAYFGKEIDEPQYVKTKNAKGLMETLVKKMQASWDKIGDEVRDDPEAASINLNNNCHAFALKPGLFMGAMTEGKSPQKWTEERIAEQKVKCAEINATKLTGALREKMLKEIFGDDYSLKPEIAQDITARLGKDAKVADFEAAFQAHLASYPQGDEKEKKEYQERIKKFKNKGVQAIVQCALPPLEGADLTKAIDDALADAGATGPNLQTMRAEAIQGCGKKADVATIEETISAILAKTGPKDQSNYAEMIQTSLSKQVKPSGVIFADSNWGGGGHKTMLTMLVSPVTGELETWQMNEDGSGAERMDQDVWAGGTWNLDENPGAHGGI